MPGIQNFQYNKGTQYLFKRQWSVALAPPNQAQAAVYTQLRTTFDIDKQALGTSNKAKIEIYGLSSESRQKILKGWQVLLKAGYSGLMQTLFVGGVLPNGVKVTRQGPEIVTALECGDGEQAIVLGTMDQVFPAPATLQAVLTGIVKATGLDVGVVQGIPAVNYNNGYTVHGGIKAALDQLCKANGLEWHVQNGQINIFPLRAYNGTSIVQVNINTGMIGIPSSDGGFMQFTSLLNPKLIPGTAIQLTSVENTSINGYYKIKRSHFEGDSHDSKWQVSCECILLQKLTTPAAGPAAQG